MSLPQDHVVAQGQTLYDKLDNRPFVVLCNCGSSQPRRHTARYVAANRHEFETLEQHNAIKTV